MMFVNKGAGFPLLMLLLASLIGCKPAPVETYLFLAHTYTENPTMQEVDPRVVAMDLSVYPLVLLGGDLTHGSTQEASNLHYLDSVFGIRQPNVHWAIGNHDYMQPNIVPPFTGKPLFYSFHRKGVTFLVLDSQRDACGLGPEQLALFQSVTDTLSASSHLVILQHKLCWLYGNAELQPFEEQANANIGPEPWDTNPNNFHEVAYPKLAELEQNGIEVLCISGDLGVRAKQFHYQTAEGIDFIASGLSRTGDADDVILKLLHQPNARTLEWRFEPI